jgi:hypothetical protein
LGTSGMRGMARPSATLASPQPSAARAAGAAGVAAGGGSSGLSACEPALAVHWQHASSKDNTTQRDFTPRITADSG